MERLLQLNDNTHNPHIITNILQGILQTNGIDEWAYSFDGYNDERQCMECDENGWKVYFGERGKEKRCISFDSQQEAGEALLRRIGQDEKHRTKMISEFKKELATLDRNPAHDRSEKRNVAVKAIVTHCPPGRSIPNVVNVALSGSPSLIKASKYGKSANVAASQLATTGLLKTCQNYKKNRVKQNLIDGKVENRKAKNLKKSYRGKMKKKRKLVLSEILCKRY